MRTLFILLLACFCSAALAFAAPETTPPAVAEEEPANDADIIANLELLELLVLLETLDQETGPESSP